MGARLRRTVRRIVVDGQQYVWQFKQSNEQGCDTFCAYAATHHSSPLYVLFPGLSYSGTIGGLFIAGHPESWDCNLHTPVWAATIIRYGLANGWQAQAANAPLSMNGVGVLTALNFKPTG